MPLITRHEPEQTESPSASEMNGTSTADILNALNDNDLLPVFSSEPTQPIENVFEQPSAPPPPYEEAIANPPPYHPYNNDLSPPYPPPPYPGESKQAEQALGVNPTLQTNPSSGPFALPTPIGVQPTPSAPKLDSEDFVPQQNPQFPRPPAFNPDAQLWRSYSYNPELDEKPAAPNNAGFFKSMNPAFQASQKSAEQQQQPQLVVPPVG